MTNGQDSRISTPARPLEPHPTAIVIGASTGIGAALVPALRALEVTLPFGMDPRWIVPVAMAIGPDGALYVADFYSHIFENVMFSKRHPGRDHSHGRIWRISHSTRPLRRSSGRPLPTPDATE